MTKINLLTCTLLAATAILGATPTWVRADAATREANREKVVDRREARQEKRIEQGIAKGYLTADESQKLEAQQKKIADLEASFKADGKLTKDEFKQLREALNDASLQIWSEKHDTEGNQMPTYRFGKNIFAKDDLTSKIEGGTLTTAEVKAILKDFHHMMRLKHRLANGTLTAEERTTLQGEYNDLLNKYFIVK